MKLLQLLLLIVYQVVWVLGASSCFLSDDEKKEIESYAVPQPVLTGFVIVFCNILTCILFMIAGYLIAGYHFYEQILHDIEDDVELHERDERIKVQMAEQDLLWQMHRAKQERRAKQLEKLKEREAETKQAWKHDKDKLSEQIKASASRIAELEDELKRAEKLEHRRKVDKIKVTKKTTKLEQGQKLLSGCETPITPPSGPAEGAANPQRQPSAQAPTSKEPEAEAAGGQKVRTFTILGEATLLNHEKVQEPLTHTTGDTSKVVAKTPIKKRPSKETDARMTSESRKESWKSQKSKKDKSSKRSQKSSRRSKRSEDDSETSKGSSKSSIKTNRKASNAPMGSND